MRGVLGISLEKKGKEARKGWPQLALGLCQVGPVWAFKHPAWSSLDVGYLKEGHALERAALCSWKFWHWRLSGDNSPATGEESVSLKGSLRRGEGTSLHLWIPHFMQTLRQGYHFREAFPTTLYKISSPFLGSKQDPSLRFPLPCFITTWHSVFSFKCIFFCIFPDPHIHYTC